MRLLLLVPLLACLAACNLDGRTVVVRSKVDHMWRIDARVRVADGLAVFECFHSASGRCHYTLFGYCTPMAGSTGCSGKVLEHFSIAVDSREVLHGLSDFKLCVSDRAGQAQPDCSVDGES